MIKKIILIGIVMSLLIVPALLAQASPWPAFNVCCEKTIRGAWCQNTLKENCDTNFKITPTSCQGTSFCKPGICFDSSEGICMDNTPQIVCNDANGTWMDDSVVSVPQCNLGCCVLGTQASFVTLTRCKKLSGFYGLETDFRTNVGDELSCIAIAASQDQGACVFESEFQRTCKFTTRGECLGVGEGDIPSSGEFFKDYLCSAEELATNCGPTKDTICITGKDEVYFKDSCGNPANIYDASKRDDKSYWKRVIDKSQTCGAGSSNGNAGSKSCGNCDYFKGSICAKGNANYGDYVCTDLNCYDTKNGKDYKNGESWCEYQSNIGQGKDSVGSRHFRHVCINGEETIEPCADYRNEVCMEGELDTGKGVFTEAACRVNRWKDCVFQDDKESCLNTDKRDCFWKEGAAFTGLKSRGLSTGIESSAQIFSGGNTPTFTANAVAPITGFASDEMEAEIKEQTSGVQLGGGACLPNIPPGLKFWSNTDSKSICSLGNSVCVVGYEASLWEDTDDEDTCEENCECLTPGYAQVMNEICTSLGDCGAYVNVVNKFTDEGAKWNIDGKKQTITRAIMGG